VYRCHDITDTHKNRTLEGNDVIIPHPIHFREDILDHVKIFVILLRERV
jgi:hypothetical protein